MTPVYEVAWSQSADTSAVKAAQRQPPPPIVMPSQAKPWDLSRRILGVMALDPMAAWTTARICQVLPQATSQSVRLALARLAKVQHLAVWPEPWPCKHGYRLSYRLQTKSRTRRKAA